MAKYQKYAEYKDSGVEWLENVPREWDIIKIKHLSTVKRGASPRPIDDPKYFDDNGEYAWVRIADVSASDMYLLNTTQTMSDLGSSLSVKLEPNQLFLSIAGTVGKPCINKIKACIHDGFVYFPELKIPNKYLFYVFAGEQAYKGLGKMGTQLNLNTDTVGDIKVALPKSQSDIYKIIEFLDHETTKIDHLIEKQQQLIELLKEKRQAVISHAVTKGLDPNVLMKDSGVEWLGEVPEHWIVCPIKYELKSQDFRRIPLSSEERGRKTGEYRYYGASGVIDYIDEYIFDESTVLVGEDGANLVTRNTPLAFAAHGQYWVNNHAHILKPTDGLADYWAEVIEMIDISSLLSGSAQPKLTAEALNNLKIAFSEDMNERVQIEHFIKQTKNKYDVLIDKAQCQVSLLSERRTALISAAVTGKIDVRHWQAPTVAEAHPELSA